MHALLEAKSISGIKTCFQDSTHSLTQKLQKCTKCLFLCVAKLSQALPLTPC